MTEENAREVYADIIDLPPWKPKTRLPMPQKDRAAQFSPFAALTGFEEKIRLTEEAQAAREGE